MSANLSYSRSLLFGQNTKNHKICFTWNRCSINSATYRNMRFFLLGVSLLLWQFAAALHFYTVGSETTCFYEELAQGTVVVGQVDAGVDIGEGNFRADSSLKVEISVQETFDNDHQVVSQKNPASSSFTFSVLDSGEHKICLTPSYPDRSLSIRVAFDTAIAGAEIIDSKRTDEVTLVKNKVKELNNKLEEIKREQTLIRERESSFRDQSETTNSKVVRWSIIQLIVLVSTGAWQLRHLKTFFIKQKVL